MLGGEKSLHRANKALYSCQVCPWKAQGGGRSKPGVEEAGNCPVKIKRMRAGLGERLAEKLCSSGSSLLIVLTGPKEKLEEGVKNEIRE